LGFELWPYSLQLLIVLCKAGTVREAQSNRNSNGEKPHDAQLETWLLVRGSDCGLCRFQSCRRRAKCKAALPFDPNPFIKMLPDWNNIEFDQEE